MDQAIFKEEVENKVKLPKKYKVVMYNDDYTPMEIVVLILVEIFDKLVEEAITLTLFIHQSGKSVVGTYPYDIANTKLSQTQKIVNEEGVPLKMELIEEDI